jgi:hypothetical protein
MFWARLERRRRIALLRAPLPQAENIIVKSTIPHGKNDGDAMTRAAGLTASPLKAFPPERRIIYGSHEAVLYIMNKTFQKKSTKGGENFCPQDDKIVLKI